MNGADPLVSVLVATRDRPTLLAVALRCFQQQTYARRELIVIDDGVAFPVDQAAVRAVGGTLIRAQPGMSLGEKTNLAIRAGSGALCQIMDDDDYYAPGFLAATVAAMHEHSGIVCYPTIVGVGPYTYFDVERWELRQTMGKHPAGGSLLFARGDWEAAPFRAWTLGFEIRFIHDQARFGTQMRVIEAPEIFVQVRHQGGGGNRGHTWVRHDDDVPVESFFRGLPRRDGEPEDLLPNWALETYRRIHRDLVVT